MEPGRDGLRREAREAFLAGDYPRLVATCEKIMAGLEQEIDAAAGDEQRMRRLVDERFDDCMGLSHARYLAGDKPGCAEACRTALALTDLVARALVGPPPEPAGAQTPARLTTPEAQNLLRQRTTVILRLGKLLRDALDDPAGAAEVLAKGDDYAPTLRRPIVELERDNAAFMTRALEGQRPSRDHERLRHILYPVEALNELAATQEALGQYRAAIETYGRAGLARLPADPEIAGANVQAIARLIQKLPAGQAVPEMPLLFVLSPATPHIGLDLNQPSTLACSYKRQITTRTAHYFYALSPPPGREFSAVEFAVTIEQFEERYGGHFGCWAMAAGEHGGRVSLGSIAWPRGEPLGKRTVTKTLYVPVRAGAVYIEVTQWKDKFHVHEVKATARFRKPEDLALVPEDVKPPADAILSTRFLPEGGVLARNGEIVRAGTTVVGMTPGQHIISYEHRGQNKHFECELFVPVGGRMAMFINLDSPFRPAQTNLEGMHYYPVSRACQVRLPDGRWLVAYGGGESGIALSASRDRVTWEKPWGLSFGGRCKRMDPALHLDSDGTLWLAYFSNRTSLETVSTAGYLLWLTHSKDGRTWAAPRPLGLSTQGATGAEWWRVGTFGGWPLTGIQLAESPDGRRWVFWRDYVGVAESFAKIRELQPMKFPEGIRVKMANPHVTIVRDGRLHAVFDDWGRALYYTTSADGREWTEPVSLVGNEGGTRPVRPQLVLWAGRAALIYEDSKGAWLRAGKLEPKPAFGAAVQIASHVSPMSGSRLFIDDDKGEVSFFTGGGAVWLVRGDRAEVTQSIREF
jgi:hypothetical protein